MFELQCTSDSNPGPTGREMAIRLNGCNHRWENTNACCFITEDLSFPLIKRTNTTNCCHDTAVYCSKNNRGAALELAAQILSSPCPPSAAPATSVVVRLSSFTPPRRAASTPRRHDADVGAVAYDGADDDAGAARPAPPPLLHIGTMATTAGMPPVCYCLIGWFVCACVLWCKFTRDNARPRPPPPPPIPTRPN